MIHAEQLELSYKQLLLQTQEQRLIRALDTTEGVDTTLGLAMHGVSLNSELRGLRTEGFKDDSIALAGAFFRIGRRGCTLLIAHLNAEKSLVNLMSNPNVFWGYGDFYFSISGGKEISHDRVSKETQGVKKVIALKGGIASDFPSQNVVELTTSNTSPVISALFDFPSQQPFILKPPALT